MFRCSSLTEPLKSCQVKIIIADVKVRNNFNTILIFLSKWTNAYQDNRTTQ